jgi:hypothetical protein
MVVLILDYNEYPTIGSRRPFSVLLKLQMVKGSRVDFFFFINVITLVRGGTT